MDPLSLCTARYQSVLAFRRTGQAPGFVPVRTSLGVPKFIDGADVWPFVGELAPAGVFGRDLDRDEFEIAYRARLDSFGAGRIAAALAAIAGDYPGQMLALLCFCDLSRGFCHRRMAADWLRDRLGWDVPEIAVLPALSQPV